MRFYGPGNLRRVDDRHPFVPAESDRLRDAGREVCEECAFPKDHVIHTDVDTALVVHTDSDDALAPPPEPPKVLTPQQLQRLGALTLQDERSDAVESLLTDQEATYRDLLKRDPEALITTLLERDRLLAQQGRQMADGRMGARLLREFVRGALSLADHATLRRVGDATKAGTIEGILEALGAEPADLRQLKLAGTTMGSEVDQAERAHQLAEGKLKR